MLCCLSLALTEIIQKVSYVIADGGRADLIAQEAYLITVCYVPLSYASFGKVVSQ